jgi:hypothetical protein
MSGDIVSFPAPPKPSRMRRRLPTSSPLPRSPVPMPIAVARALRLLRIAQQQLASENRVERGNAPAVLGRAIADLEAAVTAGVETATRGLADNLLRALGPDVTVGEIAGARAVLGLIITSLPETPRPLRPGAA